MTTATLPATLRDSSDVAVISVNHEKFVAHENRDATTPFNALLLEHINSLGDPTSYGHNGAGAKWSVLHAYANGAHTLSSGWSETTATSSSFWRVAHLSPAPENGKYYRTLPPSTGNSALIQYWDEDHRSARTNADDPWNILYGLDAPWPAGPDSYTSMDGLDYAEVELSDDSSFRGKAESSDLPQSVESTTPEPVLDPGPVGALGLVKHNEDGTLPELNESVEYGELVVAWIRGSRTAGTTAYLSMNVDSVSVHPFATVIKNTEGTYSFGRLTGGTLWREDMEWMRAVMPSIPLPTRVAEPATVSSLQERLRTAESRFSQFNDDLNSLAKDKDWCSEYEDSIQPYGMSAREDEDPQPVDYTVEVTAEIQVETDDTSSNLDGSIGNEMGFSVNSATITANGSIDVSVRVTSTNEDDVYDEVDTDMVRNAVESKLGHDNFTLDDYECTDYNED